MREAGRLTEWLSGSMRPDDRMHYEVLSNWVARMGVCRVHNSVLDLKRAVLCDGGPKLGAVVMCGDAWDQSGPELLAELAVLGARPVVLDARLMYWDDRTMDPEEYGVFLDALNKTGDTAFARWAALRHPWGGFDLDAEHRRFQALTRYRNGDRVLLRWRWTDLPEGTQGRTVGRPYEMYGQNAVQFIELGNRRRVAVPLLHLDHADPQTAREAEPPPVM